MRAARLAGQPNSELIIGTMTTECQRMVSFYMSWFSRIYQPTDAGWFSVRTPDDKPINEQDAYFWFALELIAREMNCMRAEQMAELTAG